MTKSVPFISVIGHNQFSLSKNLCAPAKIKDKWYSDLCDLMKKHHEPTPPKYWQRTKIEAMVCKDGESVQEFVAGIREKYLRKD
jgi:hypothetical protein